MVDRRAGTVLRRVRTSICIGSIWGDPMWVAGTLKYIISIYPDAIPDGRSALPDRGTAIPTQTPFAENGVCRRGECVLQTPFVACIAGGDAGSLTQGDRRMARKSIRQRNAEQRVRQQKVRDTAREHKRPTRDDIARTLLWQMIVTAKQKRKRDEILGLLCDEIVAELVLQGFDPRESEAVFEALAEKYEPDVRPFRVKRHLDGKDRADREPS